MSAGIIVPEPKALYLCEGYLSNPNRGLTDLINIFNALRPQSYPYTHPDFVVYSRLAGGLGSVQFFIEIHDASTGQLLGLSNTFTLSFTSRTRTLEMAVTFDSITFAQPNVYTVELHMENRWVCDCTLELLSGGR